MILEVIDTVVQMGGTQDAATKRLGLAKRTVERWRGSPDDMRHGPKSEPANKLSEDEREEMRVIANSPEYRDLPPCQIVPRLADKGLYVGSESSFRRVLAEAEQSTRRSRTSAPKHARPPERMATKPNQVWSWDISYLPAPMRGAYFYLYLVMDVWSRRIVTAEVHERESQELAAALIDRAIHRENLPKCGLYLHSDNGGPMTGSTMLAKLQELGVIASFSRPATSDDNPYSEALFRTLKYRPSYPDSRFESLAEARAWVETFVRWYNESHLHSGITFTSPKERHEGRDVATLAKRRQVYEAAKARHPERWGRRDTRAWERVERVHLNPSKATLLEVRGKQAA
jgi:transposase InsO family protein